jgi:hypothetical protein
MNKTPLHLKPALRRRREAAPFNRPEWLISAVEAWRGLRKAKAFRYEAGP